MNDAQEYRNLELTEATCDSNNDRRRKHIEERCASAAMYHLCDRDDGDDDTFH